MAWKKNWYAVGAGECDIDVEVGDLIKCPRLQLPNTKDWEVLKVTYVNRRRNSMGYTVVACCRDEYMADAIIRAYEER